jgi:hypothetical protein
VGLLSTILRFLFVLLLVRLAVRFVVAVVQGYRGTAPGRPRVPGAVDLVRDRVCNTYLPRERALVAVVGGRTEHFCSPACRDRATPALPS